MYTLVYINGNFNRPDTLPSFLQANEGKSPLLQIDCVTPFLGSADELIEKVCNHLNSIDSQIKVSLNMIQNVSSETTNTKQLVHFIVIQIIVNVIKQKNNE